MLYITGPRAGELACRLAGRQGLPNGRAVLARFGDIDEGLMQSIGHGEETVLLMPHAGPRVVQRLIELLVHMGAQYDPAPDPVTVYPEAGNPLEAHMLWTLAHCPSPIAVDVLLDQPGAWRDAVLAGKVKDAAWRAGVLARARGPMRRLLTPGSVVIAGTPNVGKSTLTNRVLGKSASIVADQPGTTRDWVGGLAVLGGIAVRWLDTPGIRATEDVIERQAIEMARGVIESADVLVAMNEPGGAWPTLEGVARRPDVYVMNKVENGGAGSGDGSFERPLGISAKTGAGVDGFLALVVEGLGVNVGDGCWAFCDELERLVEAGDVEGVGRMVDVRC